MITKQSSVLIIILNYETIDLTINLVKEIHNNLEYNNYSIMVIDNCSPNEAAKILEEKSREMHYIFYANNKNTGYAIGNNIGIRYGIEHGFDYSLILNSDVELKEKEVLNHMVQIANSNKRIGCVGPMIYTLDGSVCAPYVNRPNAWNMTFGVFFERKIRKKYINISREVYRIYGCCMLLKNEVMDAVNCMDERTFLYEEENILAERMLEKDYISYYDAEVSITHKESASLRQMSKNKKKIQIAESKKSRELYLREYRHYPILIRWFCHMTQSLIIYFR